ncbi:hypothetical protein [Aestuariirhabdus litorea]|nr:hypothetical protein [Aestuariirhabdus litorea]RWW97135.1 hypothetical protein DZC74_01980 [Endozoicomonadaceae bacterium GTF-13]
MVQKGALLNGVVQAGALTATTANEALPALDYRALHMGNQRRLGRISLTLRCLPLLSYLQHHRGASLAVLNGDLFFESRILGIQQKVEYHLERVQRLDELNLLKTPGWENVEREWLFVKEQWRMDSPIANFNLHSHLINELLTFIKSLLFHEEVGTDGDSLLLLGYIVETLLPIVEVIAQIRGLSTHRELDQEGDQEVVFKLNYLVTEFRQRQRGVLERCDAFSERDRKWILKAYSESGCSEKVRDFAAEIADGQQQGWHSGYGNGALFLSATKLIDAILFVSECSIKRLRDHMDKNLQRWIYREQA